MDEESMSAENIFTLPTQNPEINIEVEESSPFYAPMVNSDSDEHSPPILLGAPPTDSYCVDETGSVPTMVNPICLNEGTTITDNLHNLNIQNEESPPFLETTNTPMLEWNDQWEITLKERKQKEETDKVLVTEAAKSDILRFQADREVKRDAKIERNRTEEQEKLVTIEESLQSDNPWNIVVNLVELTHDNVEHSIDCGRMRDILISLKNNYHSTSVA